MARTEAWCLRAGFLAAAVVLFGIAFYFGGQEPYRIASPSVVSDRTPYGIAPNNTAGLAALGFATAGGFALVASALVRVDPGKMGTPSPLDS